MVPLEIERKWIINPLADDSAFLDSPKFEITQTYLTNHLASERVRKIRHEDSVQYTHTIKQRIQSGVYAENERTIDLDEYNSLSRLSDPTRRPILKDRWRYHHGRYVMEIDQIFAPINLWLMEIELNDVSELTDDIALPEGLDAVEVTGNKLFSNWSLAGIRL